MSLKTTVKVGNITNLSDARYAAGMGADLLGFSVIQGQPNYIETPTFQQIRGWVTGPKIVLELYGIGNNSDLASLIENHVPDYLEMSLEEYKRLRDNTTLPAIVKVNAAELKSLTDNYENIAYWLIDENLADQLKEHPVPFMVNLSTKELLPSLLENSQIGAVALTGSKEIRPGFKDYGQLAEILEALEE